MRKSIRTGVLLLLGILASFRGFSAGATEQKQEQKPNIIFLLTDDQRWDAMGAMGNPIIETPNMDALATKGILFQNAYVTTSICCVSRASILTGRYEKKHGIHDFNTDLKPNLVNGSYPNLLKKAGYHIAFIGKYGVGHHTDFSAYDYVYNSEAGGKGQPDYITVGKNGKKIHDTDTINSAIQYFLDQYGKKGPFCISVSFKAPHELDGNPPVYPIQPRFKDLYKDVTIPEPVTAAPKYWKSLPDFFSTDENFGRSRWKGLFGTDELYQYNVKNYYRLITGVDEVIGNIRTKLKALGIDKNTVIIEMGDNGMFLGEHGMEGKWYGYEESIRVPLLIYYPKFPDQIRQTRPANIALNIDIAPTILSLAGVDVPEGMDGVNLIDLITNKIPDRKDFFYQHYFLGSPHIPNEEGVVKKDFKYMNYIEHSKNAEELYDTKNDPHETKNLINDPAYKKILNKLKNRYNELKKKYSVTPEERKKMNKAF